MELGCASPAPQRHSSISENQSAPTIHAGPNNQVRYDTLARRGHSDNRVVQTSFKDLIPLRQTGVKMDLSRPSLQDIESTKERTRKALAAGMATASTSPIVGQHHRQGPTFFRYTPTGNGKETARIVKVMDQQIDPLGVPKFRMKRIPRGRPSPPPSVLHSPPRKISAEGQEMWKIPPPVSNSKNPKGFTVPLDKRLAANGQGLQDLTINDKFAHVTEALQVAEQLARGSVKERGLLNARLKEKERAKNEKQFRQLGNEARMSKANAKAPKGTRMRNRASSGSDAAEQRRREARMEQRREDKRSTRRSRMGLQRRSQVLARETNRDISEKIALGLAKPTRSGDTNYDARLFDRSSGFGSDSNEI